MNILKVKNIEEGFGKAKEILYQNLNSQTVLFLSGGSTPKVLYKDLAGEGKLKVGAVAMVDERFGEKNHQESNELMIKNTGFLKYLDKQNIRFYPVLENKNIEKTSNDYDQTVRFLLTHMPKSVAILGIGVDGHIAGIAPNRKDFVNPIFSDNISLVNYFDDELGSFKKRITLTFKALEQIDLLIILAFGKEKKKALNQIFKSRDIEEIPARFFTKEGISEKIILITDQTVIV